MNMRTQRGHKVVRLTDVDGKLELEVFDDTLSWGTTGVRTDYATVYFDDWKHR